MPRAKKAKAPKRGRGQPKLNGVGAVSLEAKLAPDDIKKLRLIAVREGLLRAGEPNLSAAIRWAIARIE